MASRLHQLKASPSSGSFEWEILASCPRNLSRIALVVGLHHTWQNLFLKVRSRGSRCSRLSPMPSVAVGRPTKRVVRNVACHFSALATSAKNYPTYRAHTIALVLRPAGLVLQPARGVHSAPRTMNRSCTSLPVVPSVTAAFRLSAMLVSISRHVTATVNDLGLLSQLVPDFCRGSDFTSCLGVAQIPEGLRDESKIPSSGFAVSG